MSKCPCGDDFVEERTTIVDDVDGSIFVTRGVPSLVCEMCASRSFTQDTMRALGAIERHVAVPGVESVTVDYARMVAHLTETGVPVAEEHEPDRSRIADGCSAGPQRRQRARHIGRPPQSRAGLHTPIQLLYPSKA